MPEALIIVADGSLREEVTRALKEGAIDTRSAGPDQRPIEAVREKLPDCVILEMFLDGQSGFALIKEIREGEATAGLPVLMITSSLAEMDRILAFEAGADDVLPRPFYPRELALRVRALIRRAQTHRRGTDEPEEQLQHGPLLIDLARQKVLAHGEEIRLTDKELAILALLMRRPGRAFSRKEILESVWGTTGDRTPRVVDTHMKGIRRKLGPSVPTIESLRGVGYRLSDRTEAR